MNSRHTEEFVEVNGIEHFLLHYPKGPDAPVLLYLHGGPGSPESLYAYRLDKSWGDMFTHVHWDQRGAGKTLRRNKGKGIPKTIRQMTDDIHGIVMYLIKKYNCPKIVILGHSWGSLIGSIYVQQHPENVSAYIGVGQTVNMMEGERIAFEQIMKAAKKAKNEKHIKELQSLGDYPPEDPEAALVSLSRLRKIQAPYDEGINMGLLDFFFSLKRSPSFKWGDLWSFMQIQKTNRLLHMEMMACRLGDRSRRYEMPIHYILGEIDTITPTSLAREYYDTIDAPSKTIAVIPNAGHNVMYEEGDGFKTALKAVRDTL